MIRCDVIKITNEILLLGGDLICFIPDNARMTPGGREAWSDSSNFGDWMEDRVRWYAEECDVLGGFQVNSLMMEMLGDEYSHKALLSFNTAPAMFPAKLTSAAEAGWRGPCSVSRGTWRPAS